MSKPPQKRLGRGLSSLISVPDEPPQPAHAPHEAPPPGRTQELVISQLRPNPFQPRQKAAAEQLKSLADSIATSGIIQPIVVRPLGDEAYEIVAGERRWRAAQLAGLEAIPAVVRDATDEQMLELALIENIFREDLNAIERAMAYRRYCDEFELTAEQVAQRLGEDRSTVANYLRLLELPDQVKDWVTDGSLSMGHARCLLAIKSPSDLVRTAKQAIDQGLPVRALEKLVRERVEARAAATSRNAPSASPKRAQIRALESAFTRALGMKVEIHESRRRGSGKIVIHYPDLDGFDGISERLGVSLDEL